MFFKNFFNIFAIRVNYNNIAMKSIKTILLLIFTIIINLIVLLVFPFAIDSYTDGFIFLAYIILTTGLSIYIYKAIIDIIKAIAIKGLITNTQLLSVVSNLITDLVFKFNTTKIEQYLTNTYPLIKYLPLSELLLDESLLICLKEQDKDTYTKLFATKIIAYIEKIETPYKNVYVLVSINLLSIPFFYYLLHL